ncbi:hypothetical protein ANCCEY_08399 [Ancylostoma ceylanicum]|uniref:Uncharacterized protein n=1 Tax=Ancylostoma ceylanicum TaxID=53326 RepID=A0A0D6LR61_9BILA|nr:hypothetical protein ANCCEY_08399 [Ancylostoma ceylanicum]
MFVHGSEVAERSPCGNCGSWANRVPPMELRQSEGQLLGRAQLLRRRWGDDARADRCGRLLEEHEDPAASDVFQPGEW